MLKHSLDPLRLTIVTDGDDDAQQIARAFAPHAIDGQVEVFTAAQADERATVYFQGMEHVHWFRRGHPCWRKITDPQLFAERDEELIIVDPDVFFPNYFRFERTPAQGLLLMRQKPNCLFPPNAVRATFRAGYAMADYADIGVAQLCQPVDPAWLNTFIATVGRDNLPAWSMHIEPIVWSAWGMLAGGGYLDPKWWRCWHNSHWKRWALRMGMPRWKGVAGEKFESYKCFHATGPAKDMLLALHAHQGGPPQPHTIEVDGVVAPFRDYPRWKFESVWAVKTPLKGLASRAQSLLGTRRKSK